MKTIASLQRWSGALVFALGSWILVGWALRQPSWLQFQPESVAMVINTALSFALLGLALLIPTITQTHKSTWQKIIGWLVIMLASAVLLQIFTGRNLGVDWRNLHAWLPDGNLNPGRMAPNTALGFILAGLILVLSQNVTRKTTGVLIQMMTLIVLLLGLTGLLGYLLELELLYSWFRATRMALPTAVGMILVALGLGSSWYSADWYRSRANFRDDEKIALTGAGLLIVMAITTGVAGFTYQQKALEKTLADNLPISLNIRATIFTVELNQLLDKALSGANRPGLISLTQSLNAAPDNEFFKQQLDEIVQSLLIKDTKAVAIYGVNNRPLLQRGNFSAHPQLETDLGFAHPAILFWDKGFLLRTSVPILDHGAEIGRLVEEQAMPLITRQMMRGEGLGDTGENGLCKLNQDHMLCYPQSRNPNIYRARLMGDTGKPTPMALALQGKTGIFKGVDYRGSPVIAAYAPLLNNRLGMVAKKDTEELFEPIRVQLQWSLPLLLLLTGIGRPSCMCKSCRLLPGCYVPSRRRTRMNCVFAALSTAWAKASSRWMKLARYCRLMVQHRTSLVTAPRKSSAKIFKC